MVGHNAVAMLMRRAGLQALSGVRRRRLVRQVLTATDFVDRQFSREAPDELGVTDITEHPTREGKVYCCCVLDSSSRRVVGWSIDSSPTDTLVTNALGMAIDGRKPKSGALIHSDHGTQFTSWAFTERAKRSGLMPSMGSIGDCFDNAVVESFWVRMQVELLDRKRWKTKGGARERDLRVHRGLHKPQAPAQLTRDAPPRSSTRRWPDRRKWHDVKGTDSAEAEAHQTLNETRGGS